MGRKKKSQPGMGAGKTETILSSFKYSFLPSASGVRCAGWDSNHETGCAELNRANWDRNPHCGQTSMCPGPGCLHSSGS